MAAVREAMSRDTHERLTVRLHELVHEGRKRIAQDKIAARQMGSIVENGDYFAVCEEEQRVEEEIDRLRDKLDNVDVIDGDVVSDTVVPGTVVSVRFDGDDEVEQYRIASVEDRSELDVCTPTSPMGAALLGASAGDTVKFRTPNGTDLDVHVVAVGA